jgi:hypothetical protein
MNPPAGRADVAAVRVLGLAVTRSDGFGKHRPSRFFPAINSSVSGLAGIPRLASLG